MKRSDYKCNDCDNIFEVWLTNDLENFPEDPLCYECGSQETRRIYGSVNTDVCEGYCGNYETNYEKNFTYHPSKFGRFKGTRVK